MSNFTTAAETIDRLAVQFQGIIEVAAVLKQVGSLENAAAEYKKQADDALVAAQEAQIDLDAISEKVAAANESVSTIVDDASARATEIISQANGRAQQILDDAAEKGAKMIAEAQESTNATVQRAHSEIADLTNQIDWLRGELKDIGSDRDKIQAEATAAQEQLDGIKAQISKMLG